MRDELRRELDIIENHLVGKKREDAIQAFQNYAKHLDENCTKAELIGLVLSGYEFNNHEDKVIAVHDRELWAAYEKHAQDLPVDSLPTEKAPPGWPRVEVNGKLVAVPPSTTWACVDDPSIA